VPHPARDHERPFWSATAGRHRRQGRPQTATRRAGQRDRWMKPGPWSATARRPLTTTSAWPRPSGLDVSVTPGVLGRDPVGGGGVVDGRVPAEVAEERCRLGWLTATLLREHHHVGRLGAARPGPRRVAPGTENTGNHRSRRPRADRAV